jgi:hypothetical protein
VKKVGLRVGVARLYLSSMKKAKLC